MALVPDQKFGTFQDGGDLAVSDIIVGLRGGLNTRFNYTGELPVGVVVPIAQGGTGATTAATARANLGLDIGVDVEAWSASLDALAALAGVGFIAQTGANTFAEYTLTGTTNQVDIANGDGSSTPVFSLSATLNAPGTFTIQGTTAMDSILDEDTLVSDSATALATQQSIKAYVDNSASSTFSGYFNTNILEGTDVTVASDGAIITLTFGPTGGGAGNLTILFSTGLYTFVAAPATVALTAGTDPVAVMNYVYILESTKALTVSTVSFPAAEHAAVAEVLCQSAASLQTQLAMKMHKWTDDITESSNCGHSTSINAWIRQQPATWQTGAATTPTAGVAQLDVAISTGTVLQTHLHTYPAFDTGAASVVYVPNDSVTAFVQASDLATLLTDANGVSMSNKRYNVVVWGVQNQASADCKLMYNLPTDSYNQDSAAIDDTQRTSVFTIPADYVGVGFLLSRLTVRHISASNTFSILNNEDLRGLFPATATGSGTGGLTSVIEDPTPQAGGDFDFNGFNASFDDATGITDENGNKQLFFSTAASGVNYLNITNAATGNGPLLSVLGTDPNADFNINALGTGHVLFNGSDVIFGDPGTEGSGISIDGVTYEAAAKVSDIGGTNVAQFILHRHSTTLQSLLIGARAHSNTSAHSIVLDNDKLMTMYGAGWDGVSYQLGAEITMEIDGTPAAGDMPTRMFFATTPAGAKVPVERMNIAPSGTFDFNANTLGNIAQLNVDNLRLDGNELSTTSGRLNLDPVAGQNVSCNLVGAALGLDIRVDSATGLPRLSLYRNNTTLIGALYAGFNDALSATGDGVFLRNPIAGGKIHLRDSTGNALSISAGAVTLSTSLAVDNLMLDGNIVSSTSGVLNLNPASGNGVSMTITGAVAGGLDIRLATAASIPRLNFYRNTSTSTGILYTGSNDAVSGTGDAVLLRNTIAAGKIHLRDSTGNALSISAGVTTLSNALPVTSGGTGVTTSTGTGNTVLSTSPTLVTPALGTPASGILTSCTGFDEELITSSTASASANISFTSLSSTYFAYKIVITDLLPASDGAVLHVLMSRSGVFDVAAADYNWLNYSTDVSTTPTQAIAGDDADSQIEVMNTTDTQGNAAGEIGSYEFKLLNPALAEQTSVFWNGAHLNTSGVSVYVYGHGLHRFIAAVDGIRFIYDSGNIATGEFKLYGLRAA